MPHTTLHKMENDEVMMMMMVMMMMPGAQMLRNSDFQMFRCYVVHTNTLERRRFYTQSVRHKLVTRQAGVFTSVLDDWHVCFVREKVPTAQVPHQKILILIQFLFVAGFVRESFTDQPNYTVESSQAHTASLQLHMSVQNCNNDLLGNPAIVVISWWLSVN